jgi:hypothetical protein
LAHSTVTHQASITTKDANPSLLLATQKASKVAFNKRLLSESEDRDLVNKFSIIFSMVQERSTFAREATFFICATLRDWPRKKFSCSHFFCHAIGEATDKSHTQHLIYYNSYWWKGKVERCPGQKRIA